MTSETSEITTRDVLQQIDRRLELIEGDVRVVSEKLDVSVQTLRDENAASDRKREVSFQTLNEKIDTSVQMLRDENAASYRSLNEKWDASVQTLDGKREASAQTLNDKIDTSVQTLNDKIDTSVQKLHEKIDTYFRWTIGIVLASWLSTMSAILFKGSL